LAHGLRAAAATVSESEATDMPGGSRGRESGRGLLQAWIVVALILAGVAMVRLRLVDLPLDRDEGEYAYFGQLLLQGIPPYAGAYNFKMPGIYVVYAAILAALGQTPTAIHLGLLIANAIATVLMFLAGPRLIGTLPALAAPAAYPTPPPSPPLPSSSPSP